MEKGIKYCDSKIYDWKKIYDLYENVGWTAYTDEFEALKRGIENSLYIVSAYQGEELIGMIRLVGDGETIIYIQDILVLQDYQGKGIGRKLLKIVFDKYKDVRQKVLLTDAKEKNIKFYKNNGMKDIKDLECLAFMKI